MIPAYNKVFDFFNSKYLVNRINDTNMNKITILSSTVTKVENTKTGLIEINAVIRRERSFFSHSQKKMYELNRINRPTK